MVFGTRGGILVLLDFGTCYSKFVLWVRSLDLDSGIWVQALGVVLSHFAIMLSQYLHSPSLRKRDIDCLSE